MRYWLMKSEPDDCSIDDLAAMPGATVASVVVGGIAVRAVSRRVLAEVPAIGSTAA